MYFNNLCLVYKQKININVTVNNVYLNTLNTWTIEYFLRQQKSTCKTKISLNLFGRFNEVVKRIKATFDGTISSMFP